MNTLFFLKHLIWLIIIVICRRRCTYFALSRFRVCNTITLFVLFQIPGEKKNCSIDFSSNVPAAARALRNQGSGRGRTSTLRDMFVCVYMCVRARVMMSHVQLCTIEAIQQIIYESTILFFLVLLNITRLRLNSNLCSKQR